MLTFRSPAADEPTGRRGAILLAFAVSVLMLWPGTAFAADPIPLGPGTSPVVATDSAGTAYIAFNGPENPNPKLRFCRIPRGATGCATAVDLPIPASGSSLTRPFISVDGSTVRVLSYRYGTPQGDRTFLFTSANGGESFAPPVPVGNLSPDGDAVDGPGGGISVVNSASANHQYQRVPTDGGAAATTRATLSTTYLSGGAVGLVNPSTPLVAFDDGASSPSTAFSVYTGAGDVNDGGNWSAPQVIGPGAYQHLAGGPAGLFLMVNASGHREVRKYEGTAFGSPTTLPGSATNVTGEHLFQDAAGTLHASWADASGNVFYATSPDGTTWETRQILTGVAAPRAFRVATAADHQGFAVYTVGTGMDANTQAVPIGPPPPPPPPARIGADFTWAPSPPCTGAVMDFNAAASSALSADPIVKYRWTFTEPHMYEPLRLQPLVFEKSSPATSWAYTKNREEIVEHELIGEATIFAYRDPAPVTLTVTDSLGRQATVTKVVSFADPKRTYQTTRRNPFAELFTGPRPDPLLACRTQKAIRKPIGTTFKDPPKASTAAVSAVVTCPAPTGCTGFFGAISNRPRGIVSRATAAKKKVKVTELGAKPFTLAFGQKKKLKAKFTKKGRTVVSRKRLKRVTVVLLTLDSHGQRAVSTKVVKLKRK